MKHYRVVPNMRVTLRDREARDSGDYRHEEEAADRIDHLRKRLDALQERLYAEGSRAVLVVMPGIDTAGKDGTIRRVMSGVNPQGCVITSFKAPMPAKKAHDIPWRIHKACPPRGTIGIFNRSHYEHALVTRVHGWITARQAQGALEDMDPRPPEVRGINWKKLRRQASSS